MSAVSPSMERLFWRHVSPEPNSGCWLWSGAADKLGYGRLNAPGKNGRPSKVSAHRIAVMIAGRDIPAGMCVCHRCDMPSCVNPDHLFVGTQKENAYDMIAKGRGSPPPTARGELSTSAKITSEIAIAIRDAAAKGAVKRRLAERYGIAPTTISDIISRRRWAHV